MVKLEDSIVLDIVYFLEKVLEDGWIPSDYTPEEVEMFRNKLDDAMNQNESEE